jgi:hypothetical protein
LQLTSNRNPPPVWFAGSEAQGIGAANLSFLRLGSITLEVYVSDTKNLHQQKKELIKQLNFWWHNPQATDEKRAQSLELLEQILQLLKDD